jgi:hypothetical protein
MTAHKHNTVLWRQHVRHKPTKNTIRIEIGLKYISDQHARGGGRK